jgi:histidyl-tRNA synthetase
MGLRFDLTVPLARVAASTSLPKPFKRYCIAKVWRREEPQRGRFREFLQADIDIIGSSSMACEAELLACAADALRALGFEFTIRLNSRKTVNALLEKAGVAAAQRTDAMRSLDKLDKQGRAAVEAELLSKGLAGECVGNIFNSIALSAEELKRTLGDGSGIEELEEIARIADGYGIADRIRLDFSLMRGLGYYTGPVFEIAAGSIGSVAGGGRYDGLSALYGAELPAAGISLGIERLMELLRERGAPGKKTLVQVYVAAAKPEFAGQALSAARALRSAGVNAQTDLLQRSLRRQFEYASSQGIPFVAIIGEKEAKQGKITLRNLASGEEKMLALGEAAEAVADESRA